MAKLYFKYGTMSSGKTASLLLVYHKYVEQGKKAVVFKPITDTRDGSQIRSRALEEGTEALMVPPEGSGLMVDAVRREKPDVVFVDEAQFLTPGGVDELVQIVDDLGVPVIAYGLMTDFQTKMFAGSQRLVEVGARLELLKSVCWYTSKSSVYNMRVLDGKPTFDGAQVQIGGDESYVAVSRDYYNRARAVWEKEQAAVTVGEK